MPRILIVFLLLTISLSLSAQSIILGKAESYSGKTISLLCYTDLLTYTEKKLTSTEIADDGSFELKIHFSHTFTGILRIGEVNAFIYIEPDIRYQISFPGTGANGSVIIGKINTVQLEFKDEKENELNTLISDFNTLYDYFLKQNYEAFLMKKAKRKVDTFNIEIHKAYADVKNDYFNNFMDYSLATLELSALRSSNQIYSDYLDSKSVLYQNDAYMDFFNQFYSQGFKKLLVEKNDSKIRHIVNVESSYKQLMEVLSVEQYLSDKRIRELFILKGMLENYHNPSLKKKNILYIVRSILKESEYPEHKIIASDIIKKLTMLRVGNTAPKFELFDVDSNIVRLDNFRGKYVYLDFWATWCTPCLKEMKLMPTLIEKYGKHVEFISISIDENPDKMIKFLNKKKYASDYSGKGWTFLHYGNYKNIKADYHINGIPMYYLLNQEGRIIQSPAYRPSGKIEKTFADIIMKTKQK